MTACALAHVSQSRSSVRAGSTKNARQRAGSAARSRANRQEDRVMGSGERGVFVVAGGSRGIGAAISVAAAEAGYAVLLTYAYNADAARDVVGRIEAKGGVARAVRADTALPEDVAALFAE